MAARLKAEGTLTEKLEARRAHQMIPVQLPDGRDLELTPGGHNDLIRAVAEQFLPRYGEGATVLYLGDAADKLLLVDRKKLDELRFFELEHGELPDVIAYSAKRNWLYLIEAVHSYGPINPARRYNFASLAADCTAELIYVTAFATRASFRRWAAEIAWETEAWIAAEPDHVIHFDGHRFLGPYPGRNGQRADKP